MKDKKRDDFANEGQVVGGENAAILMQGLDLLRRTGNTSSDAGSARRNLLMSIEDTIGYRSDTPACVVCGKNVQGGGGFARVKQGERMLELCCPLCLETFQKDREPYLRRLQRADYFRELSILQTSEADR